MSLSGSEVIVSESILFQLVLRIGPCSVIFLSHSRSVGFPGWMDVSAALTSEKTKFRTEQGHQEVRQPPDDDAWTVERLLFSTPQTERKYVVLNPGNSRIRSVLVHAASTGLHHRVHQLDLGAEAGFYHYHGSVNKNKTQLCGRWLEPQATHARTNVTHPGTKKCVVTKWDYDDAILPQAASAKSFIRAFFADNGIPSLV